MGTLYLVATPIGNLEDMSFRAIKTLKAVDYIAAEDTRHTRKLLNHFEIDTKLVSYHEHNKFEKGPQLIQDLLEGKDIALVTDAGTPAISDPGEDLVKLAHEAGVTVTSIPGPVALITGLILSGQDTRRFIFEGFLPMDKKEREKRLLQLNQETRTMIFYEAPHKLKKSLVDLERHFGPKRKLTITRELTKKFEEVMTKTFEEAIDYYKEVDPRGEYVLIIQGFDEDVLEAMAHEATIAITLEEHLERVMHTGLSQKDAIKQVAKERNMPKRDVYNHFHQKE